MKTYGICVVSYGYLSIDAENEEEAIKEAMKHRKCEFDFPNCFPEREELGIVDELEYE